MISSFAVVHTFSSVLTGLARTCAWGGKKCYELSPSITGESGDERLESGEQDISNSLKTGDESGDAQVPEDERNLSFFLRAKLYRKK
jgi:hypothetical protein